MNLFEAPRPVSWLDEKAKNEEAAREEQHRVNTQMPKEISYEGVEDLHEIIHQLETFTIVDRFAPTAEKLAAVCKEQWILDRLKTEDKPTFMLELMRRRNERRLDEGNTELDDSETSMLLKRIYTLENEIIKEMYRLVD